MSTPAEIAQQVEALNGPPDGTLCSQSLAFLISILGSDSADYHRARLVYLYDRDKLDRVPQIRELLDQFFQVDYSRPY